MQTLITTFKKDFDFVIYDTPPLMGFSDAKIVTPYTDGIVLVMRLDQTRRPTVQQAIHDLQISKLPVLGLVINGVKRYTGGYYGYYSYSSYYREE
jgi:Mrp family chromosome partitioning ATPase